MLLVAENPSNFDMVRRENIHQLGGLEESIMVLWSARGWPRLLYD